MRLAIAALALLLLGVLAWAGIRVSAPSRGTPAAPGAAASTSDAEPDAVADLAAALERERAARRALEAEVAALSERLARLETGSPVEGAVAAEAAADSAAASAAGDTGSLAPEAAAGGIFEMERLFGIGYDPRDAERLREQWDSFQLERLYLNDEAAREGWLFQPRHHLALQGLEQRFRDEVGEEAYDAMLFAAGRSNRVVVQGVLAGSVAADAGLETGDVILSYAGQRAFTHQEVSRRTAQGRAGESVRLEVLRGGERFATTVPRGPLGVVLRSESRPPLLGG